MDAMIDEMYRRIQRLLLDANDELLGLHRQSALTYPQYAALANPLTDVEQHLKRVLQGGAIDEILAESGATLPLPLWLFTDQTISPLAKWTYAHLLKLRREVGRPERNGLAVNIELVSADIFPTYGWAKNHFLDAIRDLSNAGIIESRKMDYPDTMPEHWEIGFLREERR